MKIRSLLAGSPRSNRKAVVLLTTGIVTLLLIFSNAQDLAYCDNYKDDEHEVTRALVLVFTEDSVRTYIHPIGYIWWEIEDIIHYNKQKNSNSIGSCSIHLKFKDFKGYIVVYNDKIFHLITHNEGNITIEYRRKERFLRRARAR